MPADRSNPRNAAKHDKHRPSRKRTAARLADVQLSRRADTKLKRVLAATCHCLAAAAEHEEPELYAALSRHAAQTLMDVAAEIDHTLKDRRECNNPRRA